MKRQVLKFNQLATEIELVPKGLLSGIIGGINFPNWNALLTYIVQNGVTDEIANTHWEVSDEGGLSHMDIVQNNGNWGFWATIGAAGPTPDTPNSIDASVNSTWVSLQNAQSWQQSYLVNTNTTGGGAGGGYGSQENGYYEYEADEVLDPGGITQSNSEIIQPTLIGSGQNTSAWDIVSLIASSLGTAASHADIAASVANLEAAAQRGFSSTSTLFGVFDIATNVVEFLKEPNWEDAGQIVLGAAITFAELNPAVAIVGGVVLGGWELYEYSRDH